ncbi:coenzyme Q-binding protein COQ10-like protein, mitochondrial [Senna tora]|uniref:Coenzyme Q-binding protein COQ10-like protein, mitochondrial n=1 Tax=Senna tora TaxID=362788 RepID=A0A834TZX1_9FABA|nr:coenzyme Q-binding protein COQ10-like protein, mitochondrial [Senna tora]
MNNTRLGETRTIPPPAVDDDSTDFTAFPAKQMQVTSIPTSIASFSSSSFIRTRESYDFEESERILGKKAMECTAAAEWTNEKHSLYLKSMEASFVNQLYDSKHILGRPCREGTFSASTTPSGKFKVLRGGCWRNISFQRENPQISRSNECHDLSANPWIQHFRSSSKHPSSVTSPAIEESVTSTIEVTDSGHLHFRKSHLSHHDLLCDDTEMSDQNFVDDEEMEDEKESKRSSNVKRLKSQETDAAGSEQDIIIMPPLSSSSKSLWSFVSGNNGVRQLVGVVESSNALRRKPDQCRCLHSVASILNRHLHKPPSFRTQSPPSLGGLCNNYNAIQRRQFLGFGDDRDGGLSKSYEERRVLGFSPEQLFDVVAAVDFYHGFVPWCQRSEILKHHPDGSFDAELEIGFKFLVESYVSHVQLDKPNRIKVASTFFKEVASTMVDSFTKRCSQIYGPELRVIHKS